MVKMRAKVLAFGEVDAAGCMYLGPVAYLSMSGKQESPFKDVKLVKLGMVGMHEAILPPGFVWERLDGRN